MTDQSKSKAQAATSEEATQTPEPKPIDRRVSAAAPEGGFKVNRLIDEAHGFFGVSPHVAAGALADGEDDRLSLADAKRKIEAWLKSDQQHVEE